MEGSERSLLESVRNLQASLAKTKLGKQPLFVVTQHAVSPDEERALKGGLIAGARSLSDILDHLDKSLAAGATGVLPSPKP